MCFAHTKKNCFPIISIVEYVIFGDFNLFSIFEVFNFFYTSYLLLFTISENCYYMNDDFLFSRRKDFNRDDRLHVSKSLSNVYKLKSIATFIVMLERKIITLPTHDLSYSFEDRASVLVFAIAIAYYRVRST